MKPKKNHITIIGLLAVVGLFLATATVALADDADQGSLSPSEEATIQADKPSSSDPAPLDPAVVTPEEEKEAQVATDKPDGSEDLESAKAWGDDGSDSDHGANGNSNKSNGSNGSGNGDNSGADYSDSDDLN